MYIREKLAGSIERDRVMRQWYTFRRSVRTCLLDPGNSFAVGQLRYNGIGYGAVDGFSVQVRAEKLGISTPRNTEGT